MDNGVSHITSIGNKFDEAIQNSNIGLTEKVNGVRCIVHGKGTHIKAYNRRGIEMDVPEVATYLKKISKQFTFDGEKIGDNYVVFDILAYDGANLRNKPYEERIKIAEDILRRTGLIDYGGACISKSGTYFPGLNLLTPVTSPRDKQTILRIIEKEGGEGVVFRAMDGPSVSGDSKYEKKFKFIADIDAFVIGTNMDKGIASLRMGLIRPSDGAVIEIGNVRAGLTDSSVAQVQQMLDAGQKPVFKLYFTKVRTVGIRPTEPYVDFSELRTDKLASECTTDQLLEVLGADRAQAIEGAKATI